MRAISWTFPYPSQRMPVFARNVVATSQPLASAAGLEMLRRGGNAVDAAIAAAAALTVVEPNMNGLGSDAFALVWESGSLHGLNASGRAPAAWGSERFKGLQSMPQRGWDSVTVPGAVSGWIALSERFGTLPLPDLLAPAIDYAQDGFIVSPITSANWQRQAEELRGHPDFAASFLRSGQAPGPGEAFRFPDQATTLRRIAQSAGAAFYVGDLAERIVAHSEANGGVLTREDLATHRADWVTALEQDYNGITLHEIPPNGQGLAALIALGMLQHWNMSRFPVDSADSIHLQIEAMKLAFADVYRYLADAAAMETGADALLAPDYLERRARLIDLRRAQPHGHGLPEQGETIYLTTADAKGMMVSFIQSNYMGFGSGVVVPGTGISLQNRGYGFSVSPSHPNCVAGKKRPFHTIIPGFITRAGEPLMSFGVMGAIMQPQGHIQVVIRMADYGQNPQAAIDAPRWQVNAEGEVSLESGFASGIREEMARRGHHVVPAAQMPPFGFGGAQAILKLADGYCAASDPRKDGQAVGF